MSILKLSKLLLSVMLLVLNWKANISRTAAIHLAEKLSNFLAIQPSKRNITIAIAPPLVMISDIINITSGSGIKIAAQDCSQFESGAHTGETSSRTLWEYGCQYVIIGHSERRNMQQETNEIIAMKASIAQKCNMIPIICIGELKVEEEVHKMHDAITMQLISSLPVDKENMLGKSIAIAYEPFWAIGSDKSPTSAHIEHVTDVIRKSICKATSINEEKIEILYGGSVNALNCREILKTSGVGGLLIGRASLVYEEITKIISIALNLAKVVA